MPDEIKRCMVCRRRLNQDGTHVNRPPGCPVTRITEGTV